MRNLKGYGAVSYYTYEDGTTELHQVRMDHVSRRMIVDHLGEVGIDEAVSDTPEAYLEVAVERAVHRAIQRQAEVPW